MFRVGENIGPYQLLGQIGEGGMGTVFKAYHPSLDRYVALKIIHPAFREDENFIARFQREARLVARLEHANIVPIYDYAEHEKLSYLVMKFIEGMTLKDRLARGPLNYYEILQVVDSVGSALAYAHSQGILHRDIKPSNVLIGTDGIIYLVDFGLARIAHAEASTLSSGAILGTPHYVSPEQALGQEQLNKQTDIYSFGIMLYELVVGQVPFHAKAALAVMHDHIYAPLPLPRTLNPNVSEPVQQILLKALAKDPNDRFENVTEMISAFRNAWLNTDNSIQGIIPTPAPKSIYVANSSKEKLNAERPAPRKSRRTGWLYFFAGIMILIGIAFSLIPRLRNDLISSLRSTDTPTLTSPVTNDEATSILGSTATSPGMNNNNTSVPKPTDTPFPRPTDKPTESLLDVLPLPPILEPVETEVNNVDIPPLIP